MAVVSAAKRRILEALDRGPAHGYEIARRTKLPVTGIYEHLKGLKKEGFVTAEEIGRRVLYRLSERGRKLLSALR